MDRLRLATVWLGGCSGCHMSFLDTDEWLVELAARVRVVYSPLADVKAYPDGVDVALVEGAVANADHLHLVREVRARTRHVIAFGDCAVAGNVTALRNPCGDARSVLQQVYETAGDLTRGVPRDGILPALLDRVEPVHAVVPVDTFLPGCPPPADRIMSVLGQLLEGRQPVLQGRDLKAG
ncbi:MAG: oxidoreductase [Candidatus Methylomirabilales bacterium]